MTVYAFYIPISNTELMAMDDPDFRPTTMAGRIDDWIAQYDLVKERNYKINTWQADTVFEKIQEALIVEFYDDQVNKATLFWLFFEHHGFRRGYPWDEGTHAK